MPATSKAPSRKARRQHGQAPAQGWVGTCHRAQGDNYQLGRPTCSLPWSSLTAASCAFSRTCTRLHPGAASSISRAPTRSVVEFERERQRVGSEVVQVHAALGGHLFEGRDQRLGGCTRRGNSNSRAWHEPTACSCTLAPVSAHAQAKARPLHACTPAACQPGVCARTHTACLLGSQASDTPASAARSACLPRPAAGWPPSRAPCRPCQTGAAGRWWTGWRQTGRHPAPLPRLHPSACRRRLARQRERTQTAEGCRGPASGLAKLARSSRQRQAERGEALCPRLASPCGPRCPCSHVKRAAAQHVGERLLEARHARGPAQQLHGRHIRRGEVVALQQRAQRRGSALPEVACRRPVGPGAPSHVRPEDAPSGPVAEPASRSWHPAHPAAARLPSTPGLLGTPASSSNFSRVMVVRKSLSCHISSTLSGASVLADRICLVRTTCGGRMHRGAREGACNDSRPARCLQ